MSRNSTIERTVIATRNTETFSLFLKKGLKQALHYPLLEQFICPLVTCGFPQGSVLVPDIFRVFIVDLDVEIKCSLCHFANNTKLGGRIDPLEGRKDVQSHLDQLD